MLSFSNGYIMTLCTRCKLAGFSSKTSFADVFAERAVKFRWRPDPQVHDGWICPRCNGLEDDSDRHLRASARLPRDVTVSFDPDILAEPVVAVR